MSRWDPRKLVYVNRGGREGRDSQTSPNPPEVASRTRRRTRRVAPRKRESGTEARPIPPPSLRHPEKPGLRRTGRGAGVLRGAIRTAVSSLAPQMRAKMGAKMQHTADHSTGSLTQGPFGGLVGNRLGSPKGLVHHPHFAAHVLGPVIILRSRIRVL